MEWDSIIKPIYNKKITVAWITTFISSLMCLLHKNSAINILPYKFQLIVFSLSIIDAAYYLLLMTLCIISFSLYGIVVGLINCILSLLLVKVYYKLRSKLMYDKMRRWVQSFISLFYYSKKMHYKFEICADTHIDIIKKVIDLNKHDEYIIVSHSAGGFPLIFLLNKLPYKYLSKIKIITMGHCIPNYINQPHLAKHKQNILRAIEENKTIWLDMYSPADPVSSRIDTDKAFKQLGIKSHNTQFFKMYNPKYYSKLKKNLFLIHFQYIVNGETPNNTLNFYRMLISNQITTDYRQPI